MHRSEITVYLDAIRRNSRFVIKSVDGSELWAVVKADAYGHGAEAVSRAALEAGARALCVATIDEAEPIRRAFPKARVIVLGPITPHDVGRARDARIECVAHDQGSLAILGGEVDFHIWLNTGMNHWGFDALPSRLPPNAVGIMSHLSRSYASPSQTCRQTEKFLDLASAHPSLLRHIANSAAALRYPATRLDAVRCGAALLGLSPFPDTWAAEGLAPAVRWTSYLAHTRIISPGESVGYGGLISQENFSASERTLIGIVPVGYGDGFDRRLCGTSVLVGDSPAEVIGRISMDAFAVKLDAPAMVGSPVLLLGEELPVERHGMRTGMFNIELCTGLSSDHRRTRRIYVD